MKNEQGKIWDINLWLSTAGVCFATADHRIGAKTLGGILAVIKTRLRRWERRRQTERRKHGNY